MEVRIPRLFEAFPWSLSAEERAFVARNLDQVPEIEVNYESYSTRPLRITHATARGQSRPHRGVAVRMKQ